MLTAAIAEARMLFGNCPGIISFGVAGGLAPQLRPGTCVIGSAILSGSNRMPTNKIWSQQLLQTFPDAVSGMILGVAAPVSDPRDLCTRLQKRRLPFRCETSPRRPPQNAHRFMVWSSGPPQQRLENTAVSLFISLTTLSGWMCAA